jgi:hypothetical protein
MDEGEDSASRADGKDASRRQGKGERRSASPEHRIGILEADQVKPENSVALILLPEYDMVNHAIRFGGGRPPTALSNQGRHVQAYSLRELVFVRRLEGRRVEEAPRLVSELLLEYMHNGPELQKYLNQLQEIEKESGPKSEDYQKRVDISDALKKMESFINNPKLAALMKREEASDPDLIADYNETFNAMERAGINRAQIRGAMKIQQYATSPLLFQVCSIGMIVLNRDIGGALDFAQPTSKEKKAATARGEIGEATAIANLQKPKFYTDIQNVGHSVAALFDFKCDLITKKRLSDDETLSPADTQEMRREFVTATCRLVKMSNDAFPDFAELLKTQKQETLMAVADEVIKKEGWEGHITPNKLVTEMNKELEIANGKCQIKNKPDIKPEHGSTLNRLQKSMAFNPDPLLKAKQKEDAGDHKQQAQKPATKDADGDSQMQSESDKKPKDTKKRKREEEATQEPTQDRSSSSSSSNVRADVQADVQAVLGSLTGQGRSSLSTMLNTSNAQNSAQAQQQPRARSNSRGNSGSSGPTPMDIVRG